MSPELRRRELLGSAAGLLALAHANGAPAQVRRREFHVQTRERFDPSGIEPYAEKHPRVYRHIDEHLEDHVAHPGAVGGGAANLHPGASD